jgi:hypothetical protein
LGFDFDAYAGGGHYISAAEKKALAENGIPFVIQGVRQVHKFDNENYELTILCPNPETAEDEERVLSFPIGSGAESRDRMIAGMVKHFDEGGEDIAAKLDKVGRAYFLVAA